MIGSNRDMTHIDFCESYVNIAMLDASPKTIEYPIVNVFYHRYNRKEFPVHGRKIMQRIPKNRLYNHKVTASLVTSSWTGTPSLPDLLRQTSL